MLLLLRSPVVTGPPAITLSQDWDGGTGAAAGVAISSANTNGPGNAAIGTLTGSGPVFSSGQHRSGLLGVQWSVASGVATYADWPIAPPQRQRMAFREYVYFTALPSVVNYVYSIRASSGVLQANVIVNAAGKVEHRDQNNVAVWTAASTIPLNQWVRIEMAITTDTATTGVGEVAYYLGDSTTPIEYSGVLTGKAYTALTTSTLRIGGSTTVGQPINYYRDDLAYAINAPSGFIGPASAVAAATGDVKVYDGSSLVAKPVKVWDGTAWTKKPTKVYNGASFVTTTY